MCTKGCSTAPLSVDKIIDACTDYLEYAKKFIDSEYAALAERVRQRKTIFGRRKYPQLEGAPDTDALQYADKFDMLLLTTTGSFRRNDVECLLNLARTAKEAGVKLMQVSRSDFAMVSTFYEG